MSDTHPIIFACANPNPEIRPDVAKQARALSSPAKEKVPARVQVAHMRESDMDAYKIKLQRLADHLDGKI